MTIDILYFEGCPNAPAAFDLVRDLVRELGVDAEVREVEVRSKEEAEHLRFLGSPSVRVDGIDVEPAAGSRTDYAFACRMYDSSGVLPAELVRSALRGRRSP